jgi:hypothetical protein
MPPALFMIADPRFSAIVYTRAFRARIDHIASVAPRRQRTAGASRPPLPSPRKLPRGSSAFGSEGRNEAVSLRGEADETQQQRSQAI